MAALDDRIGGQCGRTQVIKTLHQPGAVNDFATNAEDGRPSSSSGGTGNEFIASMTVLPFQLGRAFAILAMFPERDRQDDCVGLECVPQRFGDDLRSNRPSLRCQGLGRAGDSRRDFNVLTGKGVGECLALSCRILQLRSSSVLLWFTEPYGAPSHRVECRWASGLDLRQPPSTASSLAVMKLLSSDARKAAAAPDLRRIGHALERSHRGVDFLALLA